MNHLFTILLMAVTTYLLRSIPMAVINEHIKSVFIQSFLYYIPYGILTAMTIPYIFYATGHFTSALVGTLTALILAWFEKSLITVSLLAVIAAYCVELLLKLYY